MDHSFIENNDLLAKYLLHELTKQEETLVEEHLLYCETCMLKYEGLKRDLDKVKAGLEKIEHIDNPNINKSRTNFFTSFSLVAAAVFVVLLSTFFMFYNKKKSNIPPAIVENSVPDDSGTIQPQSETPNTKEDSPKKQLLAANYEPHLIYENEISITYRHSGLVDIEPGNNTEINVNESIFFKWNNTQDDSLIVVVIDNKGNEISNIKTFEGFKMKESLNPGLYYWQIQTETDVLHTGKFKVVP